MENVCAGIVGAALLAGLLGAAGPSLATTDQADPATYVWNTPLPLESAGLGSGPVRLAAAASGDVMAVWLRFDLPRGGESEYHLYASLCRAGSRSWSPPVRIEELPGSPDFLRSQHQLQALPDGSFLVAWVQGSLTGRRAFFNLWSAGTGAWLGTRELAAGSGNAFNLRLATGPQGRTLAIWSGDRLSGGYPYDLFGSWFDPQGNRWGEPFLLETLSGSPNVFISEEIRATFLANGDAVVVWPHFDGVQQQLAANHFQAATGRWGGAEFLAANPDFLFATALDPAGNLHLAWSSGLQTVASRRLPAGSDRWKPAVIHADLGFPGSYPPADGLAELMLFPLPNGETALSWQQTVSGAARQYLARWPAGSGEWGEPEDLGGNLFPSVWPFNVETVTGAQVTWLFTASDGVGAHPYRQQWDPAGNLLEPPIPLNQSAGRAFSPLDAVSLPDGQIVAAWSQGSPAAFDGIVVARFGPPQAASAPPFPAADDPAAVVTWEPSRQVAASQAFAEEPNLALDAAGNLHGFWAERPLPTPSQPWPRSLQTSQLDPGGNWLSGSPLATESFFDRIKALPLPPDGLLASWVENQQLFTAAYAPGSGWSTRPPLPFTVLPSSWDLAIDAAGWLTVLWQDYDGSGYSLFASRRDPATGDWSPPHLLVTGGVRQLRVTALPGGGAMAVWSAFDARDEETLRAARFDVPGNEWRDPVLLASGRFTYSEPALALDGNHGLHLGWVALQGGSYAPFVARFDATSDRWSQPLQLAAAAGDAWELVLAEGPDGTVAAGWNLVADDRHQLLVAGFDPAAGTWSPAQLLFAGPERFFGLRLAFNGCRGLSAVWEQWDGNRSQILTSTRAPGRAGWSPPGRLNPAGHEAWSPDLRLRPDGRLAALWAEARDVRPSAAIWFATMLDSDCDLLADAGDPDDDNDGIPDRLDRTPLQPGYFPAPATSPLSATVSGTVVADAAAPPGGPRNGTTGDELAAFDSSGTQCGRARVDAYGTYRLTIFGDDPATPSLDEGASAGEAPRLVFWDNQRQREVPVRPLTPAGRRDSPVWNDQGAATVHLHALTQSRIGTVQPFADSLVAWFRDADHNGLWTPEAAGGLDLPPGVFGTRTMQPVAGDWNGDGFTDIGACAHGVWNLDANGNGVWDGEGGGDRRLTFGTAAMTPVTGDWNGDGVCDPGAFEDGRWYLDANGNGVWDGEGGGDRSATFGTAAMTPVAGDWNGDGQPEIGAFEAGQWYLDANGNGVWDGEDGGDRRLTFGAAIMHPVVGDWNGDGVSDPGAFEDGAWYLDTSGDGRWDNAVDRFLPAFGIAGDTPLTGLWQ